MSEVESIKELDDKQNEIKDHIRGENIYQTEFYPEDKNDSISHDKSLEKENLGILDLYNINARKEDFKETLKNFKGLEDNDGKEDSNVKTSPKKRKKKRKRQAAYEDNQPNDEPPSIQIHKVDKIESDQKFKSNDICILNNSFTFHNGRRDKF